MANDSLLALKATLLALAPEEVDEPRIPMATALQEANDLLTLASEPKVRSALLTVGVNPELFERLRQTIDAAREAQSSWTLLRDSSKSDAQRDREQRGQGLRADLLAACRWSLRGDRVALGTLGGIAAGEGIADLIQDLNDLSELITYKREAFAGDASFDVDKAAREARSLASELVAGTSSERLVGEQAEAKNLRDRAYSLLDDLVAELRSAGQYAFRKDQRLRAQFASRYSRRSRRRRPGGPEQAVPVDGEAQS